jgi:hypothetical protein
MASSNSLQALVSLEGLTQFVGDGSTISNISLRFPICDDSSQVNLKTLERDCELMLEKLRTNPNEMVAIFDCIGKSDLKQAVLIAKGIGLTESEFQNQGGGLLPVLVGAAVGLAILLYASDAF